ncbi:MAG: DNA gyrase subunit A [Gammaproteobacteria bacterium RIFCSPHIGHO2_02_FULL_42_13]|nr:MAG: DNA gyrase subunit A [Gammaproteobacteria bacterium RIFCSPHIGHO2_02_FULL_42_13]OGT69724.1 MAG: DNA gyrase subunit A [Gammaproteobacteria bacterium RIFCSPLOWO2_02_FULL_42_9]
MTEFAKEIVPISIEDELKSSYLDYAMSVIVSRALPDVRDGLKPVHRRVLFAMHELHNDWNKAYKKSARIVGDVIGKYHPHGDTAVYDTIVRMAQPFSMRYVLVDGQGNFGSIDGDSPAAMRYTEIRMSKLAHDLLADLEKETVDFVPNYDETEMAPDVLPTRSPNLLINGSSGIAVGMATNIPPHNLGEVVNACVALLDDASLTIDRLMQYIPGPDFPTAGMINGRAGIVQAYRTGRGKIYVRARTHVEELKNKEVLIVTELPYQVNKARLLEDIANLVKDKKIEGISGLRDESDKDGMRMVIELRRGESADVLLNNLYAHTQMQTVFGINMVALDHKQPKVFNLKQMIEAFLYHRREVVTRRTLFDLNKAKERAHILEGLSVALNNVDAVIAMIKSSKNAVEAKQKLMAQAWNPGGIETLLNRAKENADYLLDINSQYGLQSDGYHLSPEQTQAILDLKLHRLTALEQESIFNEYRDILKMIDELIEILTNEVRLKEIIREELLDIKKQYEDKRCTEILDTQEDLTTEDLIVEEEVVVTLSHEGYVKTQPVDVYRAQRRGGRGKVATDVKAEDFVERLLIANTHDTILCFSDNGKLYWLKVYQLPQAGRNARGKPIINLLPLAPEERISAMLPVKEFDNSHFVFMATAQGKVKKVALEQFSHPRASGIIALELGDGDRLVSVDMTDGKKEVMLFTNAGKSIRFSESEVRPMGRTAAGVRGIKLKAGQSVVAGLVVKGDNAILTATENGYGKRSAIEEYRTIGRGGQGVISIQVSERNGNVIGAIDVTEEDEMMLITNRGILVRTPVNGISVIGRNTQGVRLINLNEGEQLIGVARIEE